MAVPQTLEQLPNPRNPEKIRDIYKKSRNSLEMIAPNYAEKVLPTDPNDSTAFAYVNKFLEGGYITDQLLLLSKMGMNWFFQSVIILFILLFLLLEGEYLAERIKEIFGKNLGVRTRVGGALASMAEAIRSYLIWRTIVNVFLGLFLGVVYSILGLQQPWTWALFTAILCYVPYIGTIIAGFPPVIDALINTTPVMAAVILIFYIVVVTIEGYIIVPLVMGRSMDLNATTVMIACLFWDLVWGTPGLFLAMPLMAGVRAVCMHVEGWMPWANLMSTERGLKEAEQAQRLAALSAKLSDNNDATVVMEESLKTDVKGEE
jgi:predicted PurR-regulated permease PerM